MPDLLPDTPLPPDAVASFERDTQTLLRTQVVVTALACVGTIGASRAAEGLVHPERAAALGIAFAAEVLIAAFAIAWSTSERIPTSARGAALCLTIGTALLNTAYLGYSGADGLRLAIAQICLVASTPALLPMGWCAQFALVATTLTAFVVASPWLRAPEFPSLPLLATLTGGATSIWAALLLERYRRTSALQTALARDEAHTASTLARIGETLNQYVNRPDMMERVNQLGAETLGCDWSGTFLRDQDTGLFHFRAGHGIPPEWRAALEATSFSIASMPFSDDLLQGRLVEIPDTAAAAELTCMRGDLQTGATLYAPILSEGRMVGGISFNWNAPRVAFDDRMRRLAVGVAHGAAVAMQNARVVDNLQAANRLKSDFVAMVSHELRTPLNVIMGYSELLADEDFGPLTAPQRDALEKTRRSAVELLDLITATLDASRLEAGRMVVELESVDLAALLAGVQSELEPLVPAGVRLVVEPIAGPSVVVADRVKVKTILKNLVGNALKFTDRGSVTVQTAVGDSQFALTVADTGIGIDAAQLPIIFEMFRQGDGTSTRRHGGVGLGLNIVQRYVQLLGGSLDVDSTPGAGSTFRISLPVGAAANVVAA